MIHNFRLIFSFFEKFMSTYEYYEKKTKFKRAIDFNIT